MAVGLRCGKADTDTPRSRAQLDSAFPHYSGGRSTLVSVKEANKVNYLVPLPQQLYTKEALSDGQFLATRPNPAFEGVYWACRPFFVFTNATPHTQCSFGYSGTG